MYFNQVCELPKAKVQNSNVVCSFEIQDATNAPKLLEIDPIIFEYERSSI
jgi:hypothetical protein